MCSGPVLLTDPYSAEAFLMQAQVRATSVQQIENISELDIPLDNTVRQVEDTTDLLELASISQRPETLEHGIVQ